MQVKCGPPTNIVANQHHSNTSCLWCNPSSRFRAPASHNDCCHGGNLVATCTARDITTSQWAVTIRYPHNNLLDGQPVMGHCSMHLGRDQPAHQRTSSRAGCTTYGPTRGCPHCYRPRPAASLRCEWNCIAATRPLLTRCDAYRPWLLSWPWRSRSRGAAPPPARAP